MQCTVTGVMTRSLGLPLVGPVAWPPFLSRLSTLGSSELYLHATIQQH